MIKINTAIYLFVSLLTFLAIIFQNLHVSVFPEKWFLLFQTCLCIPNTFFYEIISPNITDLYRNNTLNVLCIVKLTGGKCLRNHNGTTQCFVCKNIYDQKVDNSFECHHWWQTQENRMYQSLHHFKLSRKCPEGQRLFAVYFMVSLNNFHFLH